MESETILANFSYLVPLGRNEYVKTNNVLFEPCKSPLKSQSTYYYFHFTDEGIGSRKVPLNKLSVRELLVVWNCLSWAKFNVGNRLII